MTKYKLGRPVITLSEPNDETSKGVFMPDRNWYNLHIISLDPDDVIKEGDWCIVNYKFDSTKHIDKVKSISPKGMYLTTESGYELMANRCAKIIASTDESLIIGNCDYCNKGYELDTDCMSHFFGDDAARCTKSKLPQPSPEYIQQFIKEYNEGTIKDVEVERERYGRFNTINHPYVVSRPKLTNNCVKIYKKI
jgi:hypothetical protein